MKIKMPLLFLVMIVSIMISSCKKDESLAPEITVKTLEGDFVNFAHTTTGKARVCQDRSTLDFIDFKTDAGPDLNIYLASDVSDVTSDYIDLGDIEGIDGDYIYTLPSSVDFSKYKYVVVWCVDFDVNFGYATLREK